MLLGLLSIFTPILIIVVVMVLATMSQPNYCRSGSYFQTFPVQCLLCEKETRFSKEGLLRRAARDVDLVRKPTNPPTCETCGADISGAYLSHPRVKDVILRAEKNQRTNELYREFVKQVQIEKVPNA